LFGEDARMVYLSPSRTRAFWAQLQIRQTHPTCVEKQLYRMGAVSKSRPLGHRASIQCHGPINLKA